MIVDKVIGKVFGTKSERVIKGLQPKVQQINALEPQIKALSDEELRAKTAEFRALWQDAGPRDRERDAVERKVDAHGVGERARACSDQASHPRVGTKPSGARLALRVRRPSADDDKH